MSTYREIVGKKIKTVSSDPSTGTDGEMWYNSTTGTLRALAVSQAWSSGASAISPLHAGAGFGSQTAFTMFRRIADSTGRIESNKQLKWIEQISGSNDVD